MDISSDDHQATAEPLLAKALNQSEGVKRKVENCAQDLSSVNVVLKEELLERFPVKEIRKALVKSEDIENKVQECADELHNVNTTLAEEIVERENLQKQLSESEALERHNRYLAYHDITTGLSNRAQFNDRLEQALTQAERHSWRLALLFVDMDKFKLINDTYGHEMGDKVLRLVGRALLLCVREEDTVSRIGGDEFLCLLIEVNEDEAIAHIADLMINRTATVCASEAIEATVKLSIGIAIYPRDGTSAEILLKKADQPMYAAKSKREGYRFFCENEPTDAASPQR